ncbi:Uncharacterised protein [Vibrio cholerae]|nr:Uncharacterised protein [Vibrio cholerae]
MAQTFYFTGGFIGREAIVHTQLGQSIEHMTNIVAIEQVSKTSRA